MMCSDVMVLVRMCVAASALCSEECECRRLIVHACAKRNKPYARHMCPRCSLLAHAACYACNNMRYVQNRQATIITARQNKSSGREA